MDLYEQPASVIPAFFGMPAGRLMREVETLLADDSLQRAATAMRESGSAVLPAIDRGRFVGVLTEQGLLRALQEGAAWTDPIQAYVVTPKVVVPPYASGSEVLRALDVEQDGFAIVVDDSGLPQGIVSTVDLISPAEVDLRPRAVGGMATVSGVYLTNGAIRAGVPRWALMVTGAMLLTVFTGINVLAALAEPYLLKAHLNHWMSDLVFGLGSFLAIALAIRVMPLSGIHAAEHMVVHAIERGEELVPEVVRRMPRVHPRCGTNLAVGLTMFLSIQSTPWHRDDSLRTLVAILVTFILWRPIGSLVQYWITTKTPNAKQLQMGISAGRELLSKFQRTGHTTPSPLKRLLNSGMPEIVTGSICAALVLQLLAALIPGLSWLQVYL